MPELQWKKVLCPVDFSEESRAAMRVAVDLAARFGAELVIMHATEGSSRLEGASAGSVSAWKAQAEGLGATRVRVMETQGEPQTAIVDVSSREGADLIVMGTHGRTGRDRSLVGSVAESVVRRSRIPVLTVHADWAGAALP